MSKVSHSTLVRQSGNHFGQKLKIFFGNYSNGLIERKIVTFGDVTALKPSRAWSFFSVVVLLATWQLITATGWVSPIWLPGPHAVWDSFIQVANVGYRNYTLWQHIFWSMYRIFVGFFFACVIGIPLGLAMGLVGPLRGWLDPIVEFARPIPPLALIPLIIIWYGIGEKSKIILLFLAALWVMVLAARAGASRVSLNKVLAAYSLGASKPQILRYVIIPNALGEIMTGMRVALGVCWGTVVAAEMVAADKGVGMMIMVASKFLQTDIVLMGIIVIGIIGYATDILMRKLEMKLIPWKGKS
ncbi:MAG: ABC transporter permease subunit [Candidimonas sp.]|nr:MAG: ABC transporter permease subunit [Candidimonas sp.]TAM25329.1 MAG: ABC transporter permease subunit [Candidimonas sp.]TAM77320.1 MAG: ABC transporter permease subunit [Candidimonas sp.]